MCLHFESPERLTNLIVDAGFDRYFQVLQLLTVVFFFCGLMQSQTINYYKSAAYSDGQVSLVFCLLRCW